MSASSSGGVEKDSKYKAYSQAVDRALKTFENSTEWADLISALGKLTKVFKSNAQFCAIPNQVTVAKRLWQCLHWALPMGVHLKALETYRQIFDILGPHKLPEVLYLYAGGLFPLMDHCGIKVKSALFAIFEQYLVPLETNLQPALPEFLGSVLSALEEGTEFYERTLTLLDRVCEKVGPREFYASLWKAVRNQPPVRLPAMIYVNAKFDKSKSLDDQIHVIGDHVDDMVSALCATADDDGSPLVQRYLLDFLVAAFPLDSTNLTDMDFVQLLRQCLFVVLRRDMSLNRRLYTWIINRSGETTGVSGLSIGGPDDGIDMTFFHERVLKLIVKAIDEYLDMDLIELPVSHNSNTVGDERKESKNLQFAEVRVCRLLLYLQDRADIGKSILLAVFPSFLRKSAEYHRKNRVEGGGGGGVVEEKVVGDREALTLQLNASISSSSTTDAVENETMVLRRSDELCKTFNMLLNSLEPGFLWSFLGEWYEKIVGGVDGATIDGIHDFSQVVSVCLEICNVESDANLRMSHLPKLLECILRGLSSVELLSTCKQSDLLSLYTVCQKLLQIITSHPPSPIEVVELADETASIDQETRAIEREGSQVDSCLQQCVAALSATFDIYLADRQASLIPLLDASTSLLDAFLTVPIYHVGVDNIDVKSDVPRWLQNILKIIDAAEWLKEMKSGTCGDVAARASLLELLCKVYTKSASVIEQHDEVMSRHSSDATNGDDEDIMRTVLLKPFLTRNDLMFIEKKRAFAICAEAVWIGVSKSWCRKDHQRLARLLIELHSRKPNEPSSEVENIVVQALTSNDDMVYTEAVKTFHRVWMLTRNNCEEPGRSTYRKSFNRAVMILLGVLADESVSRTRPKAAAAAWFADCAKHDDLPKIVQMLSTMLLNPVTARISIQYLRQESKLTSETCSSLPSGMSAVTLITTDGKQRLYHLTGPSCADSTSWITDVRNRLLMSSCEDEQLPENQRHVSPCPVVADMPNFDDDTDSLDTLSLNESVETAVFETLVSILDTLCEDEESESETRQRLNTMLVAKPIEPTGETFNLHEDVVTEKEEKPAPICYPVIRIKRGHRRQDSLQESIFNMTEKDLSAFDTSEILRPSTDSTKAVAVNAGTVSSTTSTNGTSSSPLFEDLHIHMLLYGESGKVVDLARAETAFRILSALLAPRGASSGHRMLLNCLVSSGTAASTSPEEASLVELLTRHVRAILGQHFWSSPLVEDDKHRHLTLLELLITIALHYLRSYFLNSPISPVTDADLEALWKCKISALKFLTELIRELASMINEQESKQIVMFVQSILTRAKLQKCILHLLLTAVDHDPTDRKSINGNKPLSVSISEFNEGLIGENARHRLAPLLDDYHLALLSLTAHTIRIESDIKNGFIAFSDGSSALYSRGISLNQSLYNHSFNRASSREPHASLVELRAFLLILLGALKKQPQRHEMWMQFVIQILPWMDRSLATIVCRVVEQLCKNMENAMCVAYEPPLTCDIVIDSPGDRSVDPESYPDNYLATTLESLTTLVHFCVIDGASSSSVTASTTSAMTSHQSASTPGSSSVVGHAMSVIPGSKVATELFSTLGKVFSLSGDNGGVGLAKIESSRQNSNGWRQAQSDMLSALPHSLATVCNVWTLVRTNQTPMVPVGTTSQLRKLVVRLLSPIAENHEHGFLTSLALVWLTRSTVKPTAIRKHDPDKATFDYSSAQLDITNLLLNLKVIKFEDLISSVNATLREASLKASKVGITIDKTNFPTEEPLLELVHSCISVVPQSQLQLCWPSLLSLFSEAPLSSLSPRAVFLLFVILSDFVKYVGGAYIVEDKAMYRNVQDVCAKLAESVNAIVGWQLETTTWLKRTLVVKQDHSSGVSIRSVDQSPIVVNATSISLASNISTASESTRNSTLSLMNKPTSLDGLSTTTTLTEGRNDKKSSSNLRASIKDTNNNKRDPAHSTQALFLLAERLTDLLDSVSKSDEKDKVLPILHAVWANVVPYLKAKNARNARFFLASSQLLASMSSYMYMRPVWKKTTLDLLLDSSFFKMDNQALKYWLIVTDHLMTQDRTSFKDLLKSISYSPNTSFNIMSSKEQEYEARAQSLKRLTFVVFGSQMDQYHPHMNDIQERLSDNLRVSQSPVIRAAVFLCIRVLLLRLKPQSLIGVWPIMVTELVQALSQLEQQLQLAINGNGNEEFSGSREDQWMHMYLASCKLLETLYTLPAGYLSNFQRCHFAFVSSVASDKSNVFKPFAERINDLLVKRYGELTRESMTKYSASLNGIKILTSFEELRPFFFTLANLNKSIPRNENCLRDAHVLSGSLSHEHAVTRLENALYVDFSEHLQF
ncbi:unnamed protein product [Caenorhabditis bovis]|uniref:Dopey N-terminal domain-containing protein n=1 Tax=Caenorhabditis bovis TaxID=2654633 RepID=A0A8S1F5A6_9PELO|nr:unnamed protein product [Caenorhabditis bovis]